MVLVQIVDDAPVRRYPLRRRLASLAGNQQVRFGDEQVLLVVAALVAYLQDVPESRREQQADTCALFLDQRVGGERGAVDDPVDLFHFEPG